MMGTIIFIGIMFLFFGSLVGYAVLKERKEGIQYHRN